MQQKDINDFFRPVNSRMEIPGQRIFPVGDIDVSGILRGKSGREELDIPHASELRPECLYLGVERFGRSIPAHAQIRFTRLFPLRHSIC